MDRIAEQVEGLNWVESQKIFANEERYRAYNVPLMRDREIFEQPADQRTLTRRYTEEALTKIKSMKGEPFFIYLAHSMPHIPLFRSENFKNRSIAGIYGDVIEEIDWSVGQIISTLIEEGLDDNTLIVFTSDNGPWHIYKTHGGSAGMLRGAKGGTFEGGMRVPAIFRWPGKITPGVVMDMATTMDIFPTFCRLSGAKLPDDRIYDGYDLCPCLTGSGKSVRNEVFYYRGEKIYAVRVGNYKAHFYTRNEYNSSTAHPITDPATDITNAEQKHEIPLLYDLNTDPSEKFNIAEQHPEIIEAIRKIKTDHSKGVVPVENQLEK